MLSAVQLNLALFRTSPDLIRVRAEFVLFRLDVLSLAGAVLAIVDKIIDNAGISQC